MSLKYRIAATSFALEVVLIGAVLWITLTHSMRSTQEQIAALAETGMDARCLELELTESVLMQEGDRTASLLADLSALGISLALDDFGTGYSSLSHLKRFPITRVKIDRSFVSEIVTSEGDAAVARAVIAMAHGLGVAVVGEGIETLEQLAILRRYGCDEGQGYLLGGPVMPSEVPDMLCRRGWPAARRPAAVL